MSESNESKILSNLNAQQKEIVLDNYNNLYITACPGSGKTRTLTNKIAYLSEKNSESIKKIIAITYTNRAANEIQERISHLGIDNSIIWTGTIHKFCLEFILRKFGLNLERTSKGIKIIDEYTAKEIYNQIKDDFFKSEEGEQFLQYYSNNTKKLNNAKSALEFGRMNFKVQTNGELYEKNYYKRLLIKEYHNKLENNNEVDFDLIVTLSLKILEEFPSVSKIISNVIRAIFVDEFQDTSEEQYRILAKLSKSNRRIKFLFVGDTDQAIFTGMGGVPKTKLEIEKQFDLQFESRKLDGNYRSTQNLIEYYSPFQQQQYPIKSKAEYRYEKGIIQYSNKVHKDNLHIKIRDIIKKELEKGIPEEEICILAPNYYYLTEVTQKVIENLPEINFQSQEIYPIKPDDFNIFYKISVIVFTEPGERVWLRKRIADEILEMLRIDYGISINSDINNMDLLDLLNSISVDSENGLNYLKKNIENLLIKLNIYKENYPKIYESRDNFFYKIHDRIKQNNLSLDLQSFKNIYKVKSGINISTIHKVKGEEYTTVIAFGLLEGVLPHWSDIFSKKSEKSAKKLLYVLMSRSKKNLYLFSETGRTTNNRKPYKPTEILIKENLNNFG